MYSIQVERLTIKQRSNLMGTLFFIENNLQQPLTLDIIAHHSPWSRWQLQRIFVASTGLTLAQYVRELRLSKTAEELLNTDKRQIDIALSCGFESEISFSRSFRQYFQCTPGQYRKRNIQTHIRVLLTQSALTPIRIEHKPAFSLVGTNRDVQGFAAAQPNFHQVIPQHWNNTLQQNPHWLNGKDTLFGAFISKPGDEGHFDYWAGVEQDKTQPEHGSIQLPDQSYAVISHRNSITQFAQTVGWFVDEWLPDSNLSHQLGTDLELYPQAPQGIKNLSAEYWVPINSV